MPLQTTNNALKKKKKGNEPSTKSSISCVYVQKAHRNGKIQPSEPNQIKSCILHRSCYLTCYTTITQTKERNGTELYLATKSVWLFLFILLLASCYGFLSSRSYTIMARTHTPTPSLSPLVPVWCHTSLSSHLLALTKAWHWPPRRIWSWNHLCFGKQKTSEQ